MAARAAVRVPTGMFVLTRIQDTVHIAPSEFARPGEDEAQAILTTITEALNEKYPNKASGILEPGGGIGGHSCVALEAVGWGGVVVRPA